jgi:hypothetical protein
MRTRSLTSAQAQYLRIVQAKAIPIVTTKILGVIIATTEIDLLVCTKIQALSVDSFHLAHLANHLLLESNGASVEYP